MLHTRFLVARVGAALLVAAPATAFAYPFVLIPAAAGLAPLLAACGFILLRRRWLALLGAAAALALVMAVGGGELVQHGRKMKTDGRVLEAYKREDRLLSALHAPAPTPAQTVQWRDIAATPAAGDLVFVNRGSAASQRGMALERIARDPGVLPPDAIFLSDGLGKASRAAAGLTGRRWVDGGLEGILAAQAVGNEPLLDTLPRCKPGECVTVAVLHDDRTRWMGFERGLFDLSVRLEDFFLPAHSPLPELLRLSRNGRIPLVFAFLYTGDPDQPAQLLFWLKAQGLASAQMVRTRARGYYHDLYPDLSTEAMRTFYGEFRRSIPAAQAEAMCGHDVVLVTTLDEAELELTRRPQSFDTCTVINLPVEGLLPHEIDALVEEEGASLRRRFGPVRYIGLYTDQLGFNALQMLRESMLRHGHAWIGDTFGYDTEQSWASPLARMYEALAWPLYRSSNPDPQASGRIITLSGYIGATLAGLLLIAGAFARSRTRLVAALWFALLLFCAGGAHYVWYHFPVHARAIPAGLPGAVIGYLDEDPYRLIVLSLLAGAAVAALVQRTHRTLPAKYRGLQFLAALGLRVPRGIVVRRWNAAGCARAARSVGYPAIFRSNELTRENQGGQGIGAHDSVVVRSPDDLARLPAAWRAMQGEPGTRPSFLVQAFIHFDSTGVVRTGLCAGGQPHVRVESSRQAEGITGNRAVEVQSRLISVEHCLCSSEPLLRDIARICQHWREPLLLEFGLHGAQTVWLQMQPLPVNALLLTQLPEAAGFTTSPLAHELGPETPGRPFLLSLMNRAIPFMQWRLWDNTVHERRRAGFALARALARAVPWRCWQWIARQALRRARERFHAGRQGAQALWIARGLLLLDALVIARGPSTTATVFQPNVRAEHELRAVVSPYAQFMQLPELIEMQVHEPLRAMPERRLRTSFAVREQFRQALAYVLCAVAGQVRVLVQAQGLPVKALDLVTLDGLDWRAGHAHPDPTLQPDAADPGAGWRTPGGTCLHIERAEDIGPARATLADVSDAVVVATQPWLGLFLLAPHVARFHILAPVHRNSHFMQRAQALGIGVTVLAASMPTRSIPFPQP